MPDMHELGKNRKWSQWKPDQYGLRKKRKEEAENGENSEKAKRQRGGKRQRYKKELMALEGGSKLDEL
jgi:hypothetical protein